MKKMIAAVMFAGLALGSMAFAMGSKEDVVTVDEARVQKQIDNRLRDMLVKMRIERAR